MVLLFFPAGDPEGRGKVENWQHTYYATTDSGFQSGAPTVREDAGDYTYSVTTTTTVEHPEGTPM